MRPAQITKAERCGATFVLSRPGGSSIRLFTGLILFEISVPHREAVFWRAFSVPLVKGPDPAPGGELAIYLQLRQRATRWRARPAAVLECARKTAPKQQHGRLFRQGCA